MFEISPRAFYSSLIGEVLQNRSRLDDLSHQILVGYYQKLVNSSPEIRQFYQYNWIKRIAPMMNIFTSLPFRTVPWRILDAGCGCGSEAIFWSMLRSDFEVEGIDISTSRLKLSITRGKYYEHLSGRSLHILFKDINVFNILESQNFDIVWAMESLSHITPAENFISKVYGSLNENGVLVISDSNLLNPFMKYRIIKKSKAGSKTLDQVSLPDGTFIPYSNENLFSINHLIRLLKEAGFRSIQSQLSIYFPPTFARFPWLLRLCFSLDLVLNKIPLLRNIGGIYTIVCRK